MIDEITKNRIYDAARIVDVVSDFVSLKRAGVNYKGLCPFHADRTPSFIVSPNKNLCKCFACGVGGDPVGFIMKHEQISYPEALRYLAKKYNIEIEEKEENETEILKRKDRESMLALNEWAKNWFENEMYETAEGRAIGLAYFRERGFRDDIIRKFHLGFCPNSRQRSLSADALKAGYAERYILNDPDSSVGTGLATKKDEKGNLRDRFWGRVMFPIFSVSGTIAGFGGRVLDAATKGVNVKYQNSPESLVYSKKRELYGLFQAKQAIQREKLCFLVEGYTDVMAMHQSGVENVVASSGTALTEGQIHLIKRFTDNVTVIYDGDAAGIKASQRGIDMLLAAGMNVRLLLLPDGDDPDSFARKHNASEFQQYIQEHQVDFIRFKTDLLMEEGKNDPIKMSELVKNVIQSIAVIPDQVKRAVYVKWAAEQLSMREMLIATAVSKEVEHIIEEKRKQNGNYRGPAQGTAPVTTPPGEPTPNPTPATEQSTTVTANNTPAGQPQTPQRPARPNTKTLQERLLVQIIIRHGEHIICNAEDEEGNTQPINVATYIALNLQQDDLQFSTPIYQQILNEAVQMSANEGFHAERYFIGHTQEEIRNLTLDLSMDREILSKYHSRGQHIATEEERLIDIVPHLLTDYKFTIISEQVAELNLKLRQTNNDMSACLAIMKELKEKKEIQGRLAHACGDRVLIK